MAKRRNDPPRMVFEKAKETPKAKSNKAPDGSTNSVKKVLPTKDGIYKLAKKEPAKPVSSTKKKSKYKGNNKVQFSSRSKAEKAMKKFVKRKQKKGPGSGLKNLFNR